MEKKVVSGIMLTLLLIGMLTLAFNIQQAKSSEPPATQWNKTYGGAGSDSASTVVQTCDGGYAIAGCTRSFGAGWGDFWLVKTDASGNVEWSKTYGGTDMDVARSLVQTVDGGYAIAGLTQSFGAGSWDFWLVKTDTDGAILWSRTYGGPGNDRAWFVQQTGDGGYMVGGITTSFGAGSFWLVKTNSTGHVEWNRAYGGTGEAYSGQQTRDGGYIMAGIGGRDFQLVKTNSTGYMEWSRTYGGPGGETATSVKQTSDGGYIVAGGTNSFGAGLYDFWLVKTDSDGNMLWNKTYGGTDDEMAGSVVQTCDGGYIVAGTVYTEPPGISGDIWLVKTDADGTMQWNKTYGGAGEESGQSVEQTSDGGYIVAGRTDSFGAGNGDFWLIKLAPPGIPATVDIDPDILNLRSKGRWITAYIELPEGYSPEDIDATTILLNETIQPVLDPKYDFVTNSSEYIVDHDGDGILERMVKFNKTKVASWICNDLGIEYGNVTLTITGEADGTPFEGIDTVKVLFPGDADDDGDVDANDLYIFSRCYEMSIENLGYNPLADLNEDGYINSEDLEILSSNYGKNAVLC